MTATQSSPFKELESLSQLRDEVHLQSHLFKAELRQQWDKTEEDWHRLQADLRNVRKSLDRSGTEVAFASGLLLESLRDAYADIIKTIKSHQSK